MFTWVSKPSPATRLSTATGLGKALHDCFASAAIKSAPDQHSDLRQSPGLLSAGKRHLCQRPSGPPSPTTTPNSNEWGKAGIVIANIVLDPRITRPILASFRPEPTPDEHGRSRSRAESRQSQSFPAVPRHELRSTRRRRPQSLRPHGLNSRRPTAQAIPWGLRDRRAPFLGSRVPDSCQKSLTAPVSSPTMRVRARLHAQAVLASRAVLALARDTPLEP